MEKIFPHAIQPIAVSSLFSSDCVNDVGAKSRCELWSRSFMVENHRRFIVSIDLDISTAFYGHLLTFAVAFCQM